MPTTRTIGIGISIHGDPHNGTAPTYAEIEAAIDRALADLPGITGWNFVEDRP